MPHVCLKNKFKEFDKRGVDVVDFVKMMPGVPKAKVKSRIILTPQHGKRLLKALGELFPVDLEMLQPLVGARPGLGAAP